jgi:hypothetical protein
MDDALFSYSLHPDFPLSKYASGELGIVKPTFARSYLVVAYRYLTGKPLNAVEQKAFLDLWRRRLLREDADYSYGYNTPAVKAWLNARAKVTTKPVSEIVTYRPVSQTPEAFAQFQNCPESAFENAVKTLNDRIVKYGANSSYVAEWVKGQDNVFCHCGPYVFNYQTKKFPDECAFPGEAPPGSDPALKADRAYQLAAAHFYAKLYDQAEGEFLSIANDPSSPWRKFGLLLAARCMLRKATLPDAVDKEALAKASDRLKSILNDQKLAPLHDTAHELLSFIQCQQDPDQKLVQLGRDLLNPALASAVSQSIYDYTFLFDKYLGDMSDDKARSAPIPDVLKKDDLTDWIATFQSANLAEAKSRALEKWRASHEIPWLIVALCKVDQSGAGEEDLVKAARSIEPSSPGYLTISFYLIDLLTKENRKDEASAQLAKVLKQSMSPSDRNTFADFQLLLAPTLSEFINLSVRKPAGFFADMGEEVPDDGDKLFAGTTYQKVSRNCFLPDAANTINSAMPIKLLKEAVLKATFSSDRRFELGQAVWMRAILLKQDDIAVSLVPMLKTLAPNLVSLYGDFANAKTPQERQFAFAFLSLKNPGSTPYVAPGAPREVAYGRIEDYGNNWWGAEGPGVVGPMDETSPGIKRLRTARCLSAADMSTAKSEVKTLKALGPAPNILGAIAVLYAKEHPGDPRVPEVLHRVVKATRFGSKDDKTKSISQQAFQLLHQRYGKTSWAKQTPYYY